MDDVTKCANNIFEQPWWLNTVAENQWEDITIVENSEIIARWPIVTKKKFLYNRITMPQLTQTLGIWFQTIDSSEIDKLSKQKQIIFALLEKLPHSNNLSVRLDSSLKYFLPFVWRGYTIKPLISYKIADLSDIRHVYSNFDKTAKKNIRSAEKKIIIRDDLDIQVLIDAINQTFSAQKRNAPDMNNLIIDIARECKKHNSGKLLAAVDTDGNVHACSYFVYDDQKFYYLISGSNPQYRTSGAQSLIIWEAIKFASTVSKEFDFEGSMIEGIEKFFRQFGGKPTVYYQISKQPLAMEIIELFKPRMKKLLGYK